MNRPPTLREKIGQMLFIGFRGCEISGGDPVARDIAERNLGGVILFDQEMSDASLRFRNIKSHDQVRALVESLQRGAQTPLLIGIDQEGGRVNRLKAEYGFPESISHEELGAINDPKETFAHAEETARTLASLGINLNLAPVVDVDAGPENPIIKGRKRSFSADPEIVARHAMEFCRAHHKHGVMTCPKHFPGHGSARADTHLGMVDVTPYWTENELIPFQRLIEADECDIIMTAHVFNTRLDAERPATLSRAVLQGILRRRLGFEGVVLSDDMEMKAIANHYGFEQAVQYGIEAGLDLLCFGNNMTFDANIGGKISGIIERLVESGKIPETRIDQSFERIQKLKQRRLSS
jgi:beta-N-acetylhexosaminidase